MEELFDQADPDINEEAHRVKALIRWILQYDPAKRPSPAEILLIHGSARLKMISSQRVSDSFRK